MKQTMIQYFEWYLKEDGTLWKTIAEQAASLASMGFTKIWMPPAYKGHQGMQDVGYGVYDLYDLGEFDQKGSIPTKYGTKEEYLQAIQACHKESMEVIADIVFDHRMGADEKETIQATAMNWNNRNEALSPEQTVEVWTKYTFPGRAGKYSSFQWDWSCFTGTDYNARTGGNDLLEFENKQWNDNVSKEQGNFDYIMGANLDFNNPVVIKELYDWGKWYFDTCHIDGYRLDAIKSIDNTFFTGWLAQQRSLNHGNGFAVGEYWSGNVDELLQYLANAKYCMSAFDVPLHFRFYDASQSYDRYDMRTILDQTLLQKAPQSAVVFVDNHDTQPGQALQSWIQSWFKVHAYALTLLYTAQMPCVFYGDLLGIEHDGIAPVGELKEMMWIRKHIWNESSENLESRFDDVHCIGWMFHQENPLAVVMTNGNEAQKTFHTDHKGAMVEIFSGQRVVPDENGNVSFSCPAGSCSIYIDESSARQMKEDCS
ncbi:MAG: alpha-amylase [Erysipelotrichaceae bacterium]|nr:alpha-amylase [Erysipelotrichaceae bacterium]